jgi:hypothetical protein
LTALDRTVKHQHVIGMMAAALALACGAAAPAQSMSQAAYKTRYESIAAQSRAAQAACRSFAGNRRDICLAEAKGNEAVAQAELKAAYSPGSQARYELSAARAQANYRIAREKCDDGAGRAKDVCVQEAWAAQASAEADARSQLKSASAVPARKADTDATRAASRESQESHAAAFAATKARCDTYAPEARARCLNTARQR